MAKLISEPIIPVAGTFEAAAMARGEPGLPEGFLWRGRKTLITACTRRWRLLRPESAGGELYLRRHYYLLCMDDGSQWTVYCLRQPPKSGSPRQRWFLYSIR